MIQTVPLVPPVTTSITSSTHTIAILIGFQSQLEACVSLANSNIQGLPESLDERYQLWSSAQKKSRKPPKHNDSYGLPLAQSLPSHLRAYEQEVKARPTYQRHYQNVSEYRLVLVPVCQLITPQWQADLDYIEAIKQNIPKPGNLEEALALAFKEEDDIITSVILSNPTGSVTTFRRPAQNLLVGQAEIDSTDPHKIKICVPVETRGNYLQVCEINSQFVIVNGVHRSAAFLAAGWQYIPCLLRKANGIYDKGLFPLGSPGIIHEPQTLQRPPYICDLFDPAVALRFQQVDTDQVLQIAIQWNSGNAPRDVQEIVASTREAVQPSAQS